MKIHYFQRYHDKENVATANTMLLLSRLYNYSTEKFFLMLKNYFFTNNFEPEITFNLQEKGVDSVMDATITQEGFKILVETKMYDWFYTDQLFRHLNAFADAKNKLLITLAPEHMAPEKLKAFEEELAQYNSTQASKVQHINTTFIEIVSAIQDVLDEKDYEMNNIVSDYLDYCNRDGLIQNSDAENYMRVQLAGNTFDFNISKNIYYDSADRGFRPHDYLGLYKNKSVRAIGKIIARVIAIENDGKMEYEVEIGELTEERKQLIQEAIQDGFNRGYELNKKRHRYFFVDKFYETDFRKITPKAPMGSRIFELTQILGMEKLPSLEEICILLKNKTWS